MNIPALSVLLIVPCYNESARLNWQSFARDLPGYVDLLFMDDGSSDDTYELLRKFCATHPRHQVFRSAKNLGKAEIIRMGFLCSRNFPKKYDWLGFWDADLATPLNEIENFLKYRYEFCPQALAIFGSRINRFGAQVQRKALRHYFSRVFVTLVDWMLGVRAYDSQCGAKLFAGSVCEKAFAESFVSKWIFDLEIVLRIGAGAIVEVPVQRWEDVAGSKLRLWRDGWRLFLDLWRIRGRYE